MWEPSALPAQPGLVLLYVTYCPNPRLCVHASRLQAFTDLPGVMVRQQLASRCSACTFVTSVLLWRRHRWCSSS